MAKTGVLGLYSDANYAAEAGDGLQRMGISDNDYDFLTGAPYPEGAFGEKESSHRLYVFPFVGALCGLTAGILLTSMTQMAYPLVTGGKPILSLPPMAIVTYEGTMLGAILFTVLGIIFESRLPRPSLGLYDDRITEGYVGVLVECEPEEVDRVEQVLTQAGAEDIKRGKV
ncbi:MAG: DUF3341 domain-containing protein [Dehalococcoidia bacterium]|nr:DUF3341 domain-containing protein [Dehalococcoidia bacterium]